MARAAASGVEAFCVSSAAFSATPSGTFLSSEVDDSATRLASSSSRTGATKSVVTL